MIALAGHSKDSRLVQVEMPFEYQIPDKEQGDENYTPTFFIEICRNFLGYFDLDPFSNAIAQRSIQAKTFWTKSDNALTKDWTPYLKKFINPPYSGKLIGKCVDKVLEFCAIGETILIVNSSTSAKWFQLCLNACSAYLNPSKRMPFYNPYREIQYLNGTKKRSGNEYDQTVFYFGLRPLEFAESMGHLGSCSIPIKKSCFPISTYLAELEPSLKLADAQAKSQPSPIATSTKQHKKSIAITSQNLASIPTSETITHPKESTSIQAGSLVLEHRSQENITDFTTPNQISGTNTSELYKKGSPDLQSSKTLQDCLMENSISGWVKSCKTFPKSGIWENGQFWQQDTLAVPSVGTECLSLPTLLTGIGTTRNVGQTNCEKWLKDKGYRANTQALSVKGMCLIFGFPPNWAKSICSNPKESLAETTLDDYSDAPSISTVQSQSSKESSTLTQFSANNIDARLKFLLEQRDRLISSGASPQGVWINCGKVPNRDFKQAVWKSDKPQPQWGDKKSKYIGKFNSEEHLSAIAQHRAGQELRKIEREIKKLQSLF